MKRIFDLAVLLGLAVVIAASGLLACGKPRKVKIGYRPISPSLDLFVAVEKGYFQEEGLNVELVVFRGSSDLADAVMAGKVDFASDLGIVTQLLPMMRQGAYPVKFLAFDLDALDSPMRGPVLVAKKAGKIEELKGKTVGIFPDVNFKVFLDAALRKHGLDVDKDVTLMEIPPQEQIPAFASVDALLSLDPIVSGIEAKYGAKVIGDRLAARYIFDGFPAAASSVNAEFAARDPEDVAKFLRAIHKGIDFIRAQPKETAPILAKHANLPPAVAERMEPMKYAKREELGPDALQKACDHVRGVPWLNLDRSLDARQLVWSTP